MEHTHTTKNNGMRDVAIAIVVAGIFISLAIFFRGGSPTPVNGEYAQPVIKDFRGVEKDDHVMGNPKAKLTIVEFSDFECPFCSRIHPTLERLVSERDDIKWVYRHFPLTQIHSQALSSAIASECVAELGGNDSFWEFANALFVNQSSLGQSLYESEAQKLGIDLNKFKECQTSERVKNAVDKDSEEAMKSGGRGTPFSVIITPKGEYVPFSGALPYEQIVTLIEDSLKK
jgi:protein-disulfide isomerase